MENLYQIFAIFHDHQTLVQIFRAQGTLKLEIFQLKICIHISRQ